MYDSTNQSTNTSTTFAATMGEGPGGDLFRDLCTLTERYFNAEPGTATMTNELAGILFDVVYATKQARKPEDLRAMVIHRVARSAGRPLDDEPEQTANDTSDDTDLPRKPDLQGRDGVIPGSAFELMQHGLDHRAGIVTMFADAAGGDSICVGTMPRELPATMLDALADDLLVLSNVMVEGDGVPDDLVGRMLYRLHCRAGASAELLRRLDLGSLDAHD